MEKNNSFEEIWNKLKNSKKILMTLHAGPDGDSLGACCSMKYVLEKIGKEVKIVSYDELSENMKTLDYSKEVEFGKDISDIDFNEYDVVIFLDSGDLTYVSGKINNNFKIPEKIFIINIDHHKTNSYFGDMNYVDFKKASTCSVLIDFFKNCRLEFDSSLSDMLLLGVATDSGYFTYENSEGALKDADFLIENGAKYVDNILKPVLYNQSWGQRRFVALLINNLKVNSKFKVGYSIISNEDLKKFKINLADVRLGINELQFISDFDFVFNLVELDDIIKGSFRSKKGVDVSLFAQELGGGGHKEAAAFRLDKIPLIDAEKKILDVIQKVGVHRY